MNRQELIAAIRAANIVFTYSSVANGLGVYVKVVKCDLLKQIEDNFSKYDGIKFSAEYNEESGALFLN